MKYVTGRSSLSAVEHSNVVHTFHTDHTHSFVFSDLTRLTGQHIGNHTSREYSQGQLWGFDLTNGKYEK